MEGFLRANARVMHFVIHFQSGLIPAGGKMCEALAFRPKFKGVIITTSLIAIFAISSINCQKAPYCNYLAPCQELRCNCQHLNLNGSQTFPNNQFLISAPPDIAAKVKEVAALKLTGCEKLHLKLDLRPLPHPFYR